MATWHQQQAQRRNPTPFWHATEWTVVIDPPNQMTALMRFSTAELAKVYMRGLKANNPNVAAHAYIIKPANRKG